MEKRLLILIGTICLLADLVYEGYRSILYILVKAAGGNLTQLCTLWGLGDLAVVVGRVVGSTLSTMGIISLTYAIGYVLTIILPMSILYMSLPGIYAAYLIERSGKGLRGPSRDIIVKTLAEKAGRAFGIIEALDQAGAVAGPLILLTLYYISNSIRKFLTYSSIVLTIFSIILVISTISITRKIRKVVKNIRDRRILRPTRRGITYSIGALLVTSCLFPISGIQYISSTSIGLGSGLEMFTICTVTSVLVALALGEISERKSSIILTVILPVTSMISLLYTSLTYLIGVLYGFSLSIVEVLFRGLASKVEDLGVYGIISLAICVGMFISSILFPLIYYSGINVALIYVLTTYVVGLLITLSSLRK